MVEPNFVIGFISKWYLSCIKVSFALDLVDGKENGVFKAYYVANKALLFYFAAICLWNTVKPLIF